MQANYVQRLRLTYSKKGAARYVGHLDLARTFERSLNRAAVPIAYTQGFNRRPRMAFASPLPLGFLSEGELVDLWLKEKVNPAQAREQIMEKIAPGIEIMNAQEVPLRDPALQSITDSASYSAILLDATESPTLQTKIAQLLAAEHLPRERKKKKKKAQKYDLRPLIVDLTFHPLQNEHGTIDMRLLLKVGQSGRPDEVLKSLNLDPHAARIVRRKIFLNQEAA